MAPRGRGRGRGRIKKGMMRDDAARDAMIEFGFELSLINETIKELLELYEQGNANPWKLIEEGTYSMLFERLLEKQAEQEKQLALEGHAEQENQLALEGQVEQENQLAVEEHMEQENQLALEGQVELENQLVAEEQAEPTQEEEEKTEQQRHVEEERDQISGSSTALVGYGADTGAQSCQNGAASVTNETTVMDSDSLPAAFQSGDAVTGAQTDALAVIVETVMDSIPAVLQSGEATAVSVAVANEAVKGSSLAAFKPAYSVRCAPDCSHPGWLSSESEPEEDGDNVDDKMIQYQPPSEELEGRVAEMRGDRKRKRLTETLLES